jgi:catechol 2,3-dioxygenase-like lactoylglutathione lyase family enzyme
MKITVQHVYIFSTDLERSERFYVDGLGLRVVERAKDFLRLQAGDTSIVLHAPWKKEWRASQQSIFLSFSVDNLEAYFSLLLGKRLARPESYGAFEGTKPKIRLVDPDGHTLQIVQKE